MKLWRGMRQAREQALGQTASNPPRNAAYTLQLPLVSIVITNYNYEAFLPESIGSSLAQTYPKVEIIVVDDCSSDKSIEVAEQVLGKHANTRIVRRPTNGGHGLAMLDGFCESEGDYVVFLDADDLIFPGFVATHVYTHLALPWQVAFTSSDQIHIGPAGQILTGTSGNFRNTFLSSSAHKNVRLRPLRIVPEIDETLNPFGSNIEKCAYLPPTMIGYHWGATSSLCFKRAAIKQIEFRDLIQNVRITGDFYFTLAHCINGSAVIDSKLGAYRIHGQNNFSDDISLDGIDASRSLPKRTFLDILQAFACYVTNEQLDRFANLLGPHWLYPEVLKRLQEYAAIMNTLPGQDTRVSALAILDNFENFADKIGRDASIHILHDLLGVTTEELQQKNLL